KRYVKLLADQPGLKKIVNSIELEYLRDKRMHELDEALLYSIDEKARNVDLLDKGRGLMSPQDPAHFSVPAPAARPPRRPGPRRAALGARGGGGPAGGRGGPEARRDLSGVCGQERENSQHPGAAQGLFPLRPRRRIRGSGWESHDRR